MSFVKRGLRIIALADTVDVHARDQRIFDQNEGLTDEVVEAALVRATERIQTRIKDSGWYRAQYSVPVPDVELSRIRARQNDFTDLCVYQALAEFILPQYADFDSEDESERNKMSYYTTKANALFEELIQAGDWYDFSDTGTIRVSDIKPGTNQRRRVR